MASPAVTTRRHDSALGRWETVHRAAPAALRPHVLGYLGYREWLPQPFRPLAAPAMPAVPRLPRAAPAAVPPARGPLGRGACDRQLRPARAGARAGPVV